MSPAFESIANTSIKSWRRGIAVGAPEVGKGMVIEGTGAREPLKGGIVLRQAGNLAGRADSFAVGIDPEADKEMGIEGGSSGTAFNGIDIVIVAGEIEGADEVPYGPDFVVLGDEGFDIHRVKKHLRSIDGTKARNLLHFRD